MRRYLPAVRVNSSQVAISCPYCGEAHLHGVVALGHRLPHCTSGPGLEVGAGYHLREVTARSFIIRLLTDAGFDRERAVHILNLAIANRRPSEPASFPLLPTQRQRRRLLVRKVEALFLGEVARA
jgi:hypothetical protein